MLFSVRHDKITPGNLPASVVVNGQNTVTNAISGKQMFFSLTQQSKIRTMKNRKQNLFVALALLSEFNLQPSTAFVQGTAFTYQGRLNDGGSPASGGVTTSNGTNYLNNISPTGNLFFRF